MAHASSLPVTVSDRQMSKQHLKLTMKAEKAQSKLVKAKIKDHAKAVKQALKRGDKQSAAYNRQHLQGHQKELAAVKRDMADSAAHLARVKALKKA